LIPGQIKFEILKKYVIACRFVNSIAFYQWRLASEKCHDEASKADLIELIL
jgi:hypothetical protein